MSTDRKEEEIAKTARLGEQQVNRGNGGETHQVAGPTRFPHEGELLRMAGE